MAGGEAELACCGIPTEAVLDPAATIFKDRRAGVVTGTEEPGEGNYALCATLTNRDTLSVVGVGGAAALSQRFARKALAVVGLERQRVTGLALDIHFVLMARSAGKG